MTMIELYQQIISSFLELPGVGELLQEPVRVVPDVTPEHTLLPENDPPGLVSKPEYRVTAFFRDSAGEAYTECPQAFEGTLREALDLPVSERGISGAALAAINAVMHDLDLCPGAFPDDEQAHARYADALFRHVSERFGKDHIVLVGYDGYIVKKFVEEGMDFWTLDRNPDNITKNRFEHVIVNSGKYNREACFAWGKVILLTGSSLCNGTAVQYLDQGVPILFYGITCAGAATLLGLDWFPPAT